MNFVSYVLAVNQDVQDRVVQEIQDELKEVADRFFVQPLSVLMNGKILKMQS
jgi:hypothetical protein